MKENYNMCGFAGIINTNGINLNMDLENKMKNALERLYPRGPDQQGKWIDKKGYFVHSRLSIIDTSDGGKQPMKKHNKVLIFNGEIYNFKELQNKINNKVTAFNDTRVILNLFLKYGLDSFKMLRGMFAIAIWQPKEKKLIL